GQLASLTDAENQTTSYLARIGQTGGRADRGSMSHGSHYTSPPGLRSRSLGSMSDGCQLPIQTTCPLAKRCVGGMY
ncbi:MAG: hypothetical protein ACK6DC_17810, partial [Planctomycetota bacterium]